MKNTIIPAILEGTFSEIEHKIEEVFQYVTKIHIDICDGLFVKQMTWPYSESPNNRIGENYHVRELLNEDMGLPQWEHVSYEFDLMVQNPNFMQDVWGRIGAQTLILHPTSFKDVEIMKAFVDEMRSYMVDIVIAVTFDEYQTYVDLIKEMIEQKAIVALQIMTIQKIGSQGQKFDVRCLDLIEEVRRKYPDTTIRVDGGINDKTILDLIDVHVDEFVVGSAIFKSGNARENLNYFQDLC